jgi:HD-GYP domain-containing protein (c-di-GMP phosphodiesterase class II)
MAVPDAILQKPGPLTADERKIMQQHPLFGEDIISGIPFLKPSSGILRSHHERWDGNGYPDGLKGNAIPLQARIFTMADHWDALTSDRPYRKAWSRKKTIAYLQENSGKIFDPKIVETFLAIILYGKEDVI